MRAEIEDIPAVVERVLRDGAAEQTTAAEAIRARSPRWVSVVGRGTSDHAALYARYLLEGLLGLPVMLAAPSLTTLYGGGQRWADALVLAVSQSGAGPDVLEVTTAARASGATTVAVTNDPRSPLAAAAEFVLDVRAGPERSVAATKSYVGELAAIAALSGRLARRDVAARLQAALEDVPGAVRAVIAECEPRLGEVARIVSDGRGALVVARGIELPTALEIALKLKETSAIFADGYSGADLLHGPIVLAGPDVPAVVVRQAGAVGAALDVVVDRLRAEGSPVVRIVDAEAGAAGQAAPAVPAGAAGDGAVTVDLVQPAVVDELVGPLVHVVPGQLVAEAVARLRGRDPDAPEGLTKVTKTR
ncbi:MAG TPA: SIS domain-containing protein [Candidatus Limnocylindrales bacterium]